MTPDAVAYAAMCERYTDVNTATDNYLGTTYHGYRPQEITDQHIDYCFINDDITPVSQKVITDTVDGNFPSDYYGLFIKLRF